MTTSGNQSNKVATRKSQLQLVLGNFSLPVAALPSLRKSSNKAMIFLCVCFVLFTRLSKQVQALLGGLQELVQTPCLVELCSSLA